MKGKSGSKRISKEQGVFDQEWRREKHLLHCQVARTFRRTMACFYSLTFCPPYTSCFFFFLFPFFSGEVRKQFQREQQRAERLESSQAQPTLSSPLSGRRGPQCDRTGRYAYTDTGSNLSNGQPLIRCPCPLPNIQMMSS